MLARESANVKPQTMKKDFDKWQRQIKQAVTSPTSLIIEQVPTSRGFSAVTRLPLKTNSAKPDWVSESTFIGTGVPMRKYQLLQRSKFKQTMTLLNDCPTSQVMAMAHRILRGAGRRRDEGKPPLPMSVEERRGWETADDRDEKTC